jgi:hypothetical protein
VTILCQDAREDVVRRLQSYFQDENTNLLAIHPAFLPFLFQKFGLDCYASDAGKAVARAIHILEKAGHGDPEKGSQEELDVEKDAEEALLIQENIVECMTWFNIFKELCHSLQKLMHEQNEHFATPELEPYFRDAAESIADQLDLMIQDIDCRLRGQGEYLTFAKLTQDWVTSHIYPFVPTD